MPRGCCGPAGRRGRSIAQALAIGLVDSLESGQRNPLWASCSSTFARFRPKCNPGIGFIKEGRVSYDDEYLRQQHEEMFGSSPNRVGDLNRFSPLS